MLQNSGNVDRGIRVLAGAAILFLMFIGKIGAWGWLGAVLMLTGLVGFCPLYRLFGWSTTPNRPAHG